MSVLSEVSAAQIGDTADALIRLLGAFWEIPIVQRVTFCRSATQAQVWMFLREDERTYFERAVLAERDYRRDVKHLPLDFRFVVLPEVDQAQLPEGIILFERG